MIFLPTPLKRASPTGEPGGSDQPRRHPWAERGVLPCGALIATDTTPLAPTLQSRHAIGLRFQNQGLLQRLSLLGVFR